MMDKRFIDELNERIARAMQGSPVADVEKNVRAALAGWFDRMQLVPREDFEVQRRLLERAQAKLAELEKRISDLETRRPAQPPHK
jgi:BMFP domain-containing protein YqiC